MSTPEAVVAATLRQHRPKGVADRTSRPGFCIWHNGCEGCDWIGDAHADHVAAVVIEQLGLGDQWGVVTEDVFADETPDDYADDQAHAEEIAADRCQSCDNCRNALPKHVVRRYVTKWVAVDGSDPDAC